MEFKYSGNKLECPYCGAIQDDTDYRDADDDEWECQSCEKEFEVTCEYEPVYRVRKIESEEQQ